MASLFRSNSTRGKKATGLGQLPIEQQTRPKSPFGDLNLFGRKQSRVQEPYARPSTAEPAFYSTSRSQSPFRFGTNPNVRPNLAVDTALASNAIKPSGHARSDTMETVYIGLDLKTSYHGSQFSQKPYEPTQPKEPAPRPRKDSLFSPQSRGNSAANSPNRGRSPQRLQHMQPPASVGRPKLNRWRSITGMFGGKKSISVSQPSGVVRTQSMMDLNSFAPPQQTSYKMAPTHVRSESRATTRDNPLRSNPLNASVLAFKQSTLSPLPPTPPPYITETFLYPATPTEPEIPKLDVSIPDSRMERYSVMFENISMLRKTSIRERRLSGGKSQVTIKPLKVKTPERAPKTPGRRGRSSSQSSIKSGGQFKLFPSGANTSTQSLHRRQNTPPRPAGLKRLHTAPELLSPLEPPPTLRQYRPRSSSRGSEGRPSTAKSIDYNTESPANESPVTPAQELEPAAMFLTSRKAAPWEHRRMQKSASANNLRGHSRTESTDSVMSITSVTSNDYTQMSGNPFKHSTIIEETEDIDDWHHQAAEVGLARSLSVTRTTTTAAKPRLQQVKLVPVQMDSTEGRYLEARSSTYMTKDNRHRQSFTVLIEDI